MGRPFAEQLQALRQRRGLTQDELAAAVGVTAEEVAGWERGLPPPPWSTLVDLADALRVPLSALRPPPAGRGPNDAGGEVSREE